MNLIKLFKKIWPYVRPYRWLVLITLILTLIGSLMAQVNAIVLDKTVDAVNSLIGKRGIIIAVADDVGAFGKVFFDAVFGAYVMGNAIR